MEYDGCLRGREVSLPRLLDKGPGLELSYPPISFTFSAALFLTILKWAQVEHKSFIIQPRPNSQDNLFFLNEHNQLKYHGPG